MDETELARRSTIARRMKAARWLAGTHKRKSDGNGWEVVALSQDELAQRLSADGFKATKIGAIERMERHTPPMELRAIAEALGVRRDWLSGAEDDLSLELEATNALLDALGPTLLAAVQDARQGQEQAPRGVDGPDHQEGPPRAGG